MENNTLVKLNISSFIACFQPLSVIGNELFKEIPKYNGKKCNVLQIMALNDGWLLAEISINKQQD